MQYKFYCCNCDKNVYIDIPMSEYNHRYNDPQFLEGRQPENGKKKLNWTVFLALFAVFSSDERTLKMLDSMEVFQEGVAKEM